MSWVELLCRDMEHGCNMEPGVCVCHSSLQIGVKWERWRIPG